MNRVRLLAIMIVCLSLGGAQSAAAALAVCQSGQAAACCCTEAGMQPSCGGMCSTDSHPAPAEELTATSPSPRSITFSPTVLASVAPAGKPRLTAAAPCRNRQASHPLHASPPKTYLLDCTFRL